MTKVEVADAAIKWSIKLAQMKMAVKTYSGGRMLPEAASTMRLLAEFARAIGAED